MKSKTLGFSLIEVLIAMVILSIALVGIMRFMNQSTASHRELNLRLYANLSANNALTEIKLKKDWPEIGHTSFSCSQVEYSLICERSVNNTPNPNFRRVEITVYQSINQVKTGPRLAGLVHILANEKNNAL